MSYFTYRAQPKRVIDGDTVELLVDLGFNNYKVITVRVEGVDTAEIYGVKKESDEYLKGSQQKEFVTDFLGEQPDDLETWPLAVRTSSKGKYGRWVGRIWNGSESLTEALIEEWPDVEKSYE